MFSNTIDDLRPLPSFPRSSDKTQAADFSLGQRLYKPAQYHLTVEKRVLSFDKEPHPNR